MDQDKKERFDRAMHILDIVDRVARQDDQKGAANPGGILAVFVRASLMERPTDDPRKVIIDAFKNLRKSMTTIRDELDCLDSVGKYK